MKREQLIKKISDQVLNNAKKGKVTTTKFVGTYNYKSGYDTYVAVALDKDNKLIVYSYYQNDRGEHLDTYTKKLVELTDKELAEVLENINTKDKEILDIIAWDVIDEKAVEIFVKLGLYTPKPKKDFEIDINKLPELSDKKDGYWVDRKGNVGLMKYIGDVAYCSKYSTLTNKNDERYYRIYDAVGLKLDYPYETISAKTKNDFKSKYNFFGYKDRPMKNDGIFKVLDHRERSPYAYVFVATKDMLINLIDKSRGVGLKTYYYVGNDLSTWIKETQEEPTTEDGAKAFTDREEANKYYNQLKEEYIAKFKDWKEKLQEKKNRLQKILDENCPYIEKDFSINAKDAKPGVEYMFAYTYMHHTENYRNVEFHHELKETFVIDHIDEYGFPRLKDGRIIRKSEKLITTENDKLVEQTHKFSKLPPLICEIDDTIKHRLDVIIKHTDLFKPFSESQNTIPEWYERDFKKLMETDCETEIQALKTITV